MPMTLTRSLLTILVPGLVAVAPWLVWLVQHTPATLGADESTTLANALIFALVVVAGSTCEGLGTYLEAKWDSEREEEFQVQEHWLRYLRFCGDREPVAFRYLSRLVTTMYFELSMLFAVPLFILGTTLLAALRFEKYAIPISAVGIMLLPASALYFRHQAKQTHEGICRVRKEIDLPN